MGKLKQAMQSYTKAYQIADDKADRIKELEKECTRLNKLYHQISLDAINDYIKEYGYNPPKAWYDKREEIHIKLKEKRLELENVKKS